MHYDMQVSLIVWIVCEWVQTFLHGHAMEWWAMEKQKAFIDLGYTN
jgi:hypothetical membrane protein